jgi:hypothetical protein
MTTYTFIFQCNDDKSATVSYQPTPPAGLNPGSVQFAEADTVLPVLLAPNGSPDAMTSVDMRFTNQEGPVSPFGDGTQRDFTWRPGDPVTETVDEHGAWTWTATVTAASGATYFLPDPELQVGLRPRPNV